MKKTLMLKNKNFVYLWVSQLLSQLTVNIMNFLLLAKLYVMTGSSIATSLLWVAYALPAIFFGPIGAASVDIVNRKKILVITNFFQALTVFLYIFVQKEPVFLLYAVILIYSFLNQFYLPAEGSTLPSVVSKKNLSQANSIFFLTQQLALVAGFGLAGIIQKFIGFTGSLILCSSLLFVAFLSVSFLPDIKPRRKIPAKVEDLLRTVFDHIIDGYKFIKDRKSVLFPLMLLFIIQVGLSIVITTIPTIATEILKINISYAGLMIVVPAGIGAVIGAVLVNKLLHNGMRKIKIINLGLVCLGVSVLGLVYGFTETSPLFVTLAGLGFVSVNIPALTYLQEVTPVWLRGRVFGNLWFFVTMATIFPVIFSGIISEIFGVKTLLTIMSLGILLIAYYSFQKSEQMIEDNLN